MNTLDFLIKYVKGACYRPGYRVFTDPTELNGVKLTRIKLLGARIREDRLKDIKDICEGDILEEGYIIYRIDRNIYSTGGKYSSPEDVCIYLKDKGK